MANTVIKITDVPTSTTVSNSHHFLSLDTSNNKTRMVDVDDIKDYILANNKPYGIVGFYPGIPDANSLIAMHVAVLDVSFPTNLTNSKCVSLTAPTNNANLTIYIDDVATGNIRFASTTNTATFNCPAFTLNTNSILKVVGPEVSDVTLSDISFTLLGSR